MALVGISMALVTLFLLLAVFYFSKTSHLIETPQICWSKLVLASFYTFLEAALILAVSIFFSSFSSSALLSLFLTLAIYIVGESTHQVLSIMKGPLGRSTSPLIKGLVKVVFYIFPDLSLFDIKLAAVHNLPLQSAYLLRTLAYGVAYILFLLVVATFIFRKREMK